MVCREEWDVPTQLDFEHVSNRLGKNLGLPSGLLFHCMIWVLNQTRISHFSTCFVGILSLPLDLVARSEVSPLLKRRCYERDQMVVNPQCLLRMSAGLDFPMKLEIACCNCFSNSVLGSKMGSLGESGSRDGALVTTALLSPNM